jgi:hypothetical protein
LCATHELTFTEQAHTPHKPHGGMVTFAYLPSESTQLARLWHAPRCPPVPTDLARTHAHTHTHTHTHTKPPCTQAGVCAQGEALMHRGQRNAWTRGVNARVHRRDARMYRGGGGREGVRAVFARLLRTTAPRRVTGAPRHEVPLRPPLRLVTLPWGQPWAGDAHPGTCE